MMYRHDDKCFNPDFKTAAALHNLMLVSREKQILFFDFFSTFFKIYHLQDKSNNDNADVNNHVYFGWPAFDMEEVGERPDIVQGIEVPVVTLHRNRFSRSRSTEMIGNFES